jgi:hypothetical protein
VNGVYTCTYRFAPLTSFLTDSASHLGPVHGLLPPPTVRPAPLPA